MSQVKPNEPPAASTAAPGEPQSKAKLCRTKARECEAMADQARENVVKHQFLELAEQWRTLAKVFDETGRQGAN